MTIHRTPIRETAQSYIDFGFAVVPLHGKDAYITGWQEHTFGPDDFAEGDNVGVKLGPPSGNLLDVDLDHLIAVKLAKHFLPKGAAVFGRPSNPSSHWLYVADPGVEDSFRKEFRDPDTRELFLELRGDRHYTMFPGSIHPDDELVDWETEHAPPDVAYETLETGARWLAAATYLVLHWPDWKTQHHDLILPLAGMMATGGIDRKQASDFLSVVTVTANDVEPHKRQQIVESTFDKVAEGEPVSGRKKLAEIIGTKPARTLSDWLGCNQTGTAIERKMTDVDNADRLVARNPDRILYVADQKTWFLWDGRRHAEDQKDQIFELAKEVGRSIPDEAKGRPADEYAKYLKWAGESLSASRIRNMIALAQSDPDVAALTSEFDTNPYVINALNGVVNLETGGIAPHDPHDRHSKIVPYALDWNARCPMWEAFLERSIPDPEMRSLFQRIAGYSLTGLNREKAFYLIDGPKNSGKTTAINILRWTTGEYGEVASDAAFGAIAGRESRPNDLWSLVGKRFVVWSETEATMRLNAARVKAVTGMNDVVVRKLYGEHVTVTLPLKLFIETNEPPKIPEADDAIWSRVVRIPFLQQIPEGQQRGAYADAMRSELPAIFRWRVEGAIDYFKHGGLDIPDVAKKAARELREFQSDIADFVAEDCTLDPSASVSTKELYGRYVTYCEQSGIRYPTPRRAFTAQIEKFPGVELAEARARERVFRGISVRQGAFLRAVPLNLDLSGKKKEAI